jgi:hypothetical protein
MMDELSSSTLRLVHRFVKRQEVVAHAIGELRPDWMLRVRLDNDNESQVTELLRAVRKHAKTPQMGYWGKNKEWKYRLHGAGCELTNIETGEPLEWDVYGLTTFDRFWFAYYVLWLFNAEPDNPDSLGLIASGATRDRHELFVFIATILDALVEEHLLTTDGSWKGIKYTVVAE